MTRISIFMASYNHARYVRESIQSVLDQSCTDFELFIIDDASTDESWGLIESFTDPRIRASRNPTNRNDKQPLREVIQERAQGEYLAVHHSDNLWAPTKLEQQVRFLDAHPEIGAVFTHAHVIDQNGAPLTDPSHFHFSIFDQPNRTRHEWLQRFFYAGNALCHPSVLIRRRCYDDCGLYRDGFAQIPDLDMWVRLCQKYEIHVLPEKLVHYRVSIDPSYPSGIRPEVRARAAFETFQVLQHYRRISTFDELVRIFPSAQQYWRPEGSDIGYVLGQISLAAPNTGPVHRLFGLQLLFEAVSDPERAERIAALYGFRHKDFTALTAKYNVFSVKT